MNETECDNLIKTVKWTDPSNLISLAILEFINVLVIGGNLLVIAAVFCSNKLRSVTNFFIVNLAVADLLVGLAVLPFSATWEVFKVWIFGDVWCRIWLAVDVWMCTASILNLCAISLDRYVAVTRPVTYPSIMSTKKAKSLIAGIWVLSFVICFPPLVGWKDTKPIIQQTYTRGNYTLYYASTSSTTSTDSSLSSSTTSTSTSSPSSAANMENRQKRFSTITNAPYLRPPVSAQALKSARVASSSLSSSESLPSSSSLYNSYNPYDPYYAHLQDNMDVKSENNQINDAAATTTASSHDNIANTEDFSTLLSDSSESTIRHNNDPTSALYNTDYDTDSRERRVVTNSYTNSFTTPSACPWKCELTNDRGYVLYSALGSFYIPMFVMLFFYWRIYRAAVRTTRAINQGFKTTKGSPHESRTNRVDESQLILRIHRGRPCSTPQRTPLSVHSMSSTLSVNSDKDEMYPLQHHHHASAAQMTGTPKRATSMRVPRPKHEKVSIKVSFPSSENMLDSTMSINSTPPTYAALVTTTSNNLASSTKTSSLTNGRRSSFKSSLFEIGETTFNVDNAVTAENTPSHTSKLLERNQDSIIKKTDPKKHRPKRSVKFQVKRFKVETKAAKTLAIIVGGFIFCWLPFFTMYLIRAFCESCIQPTVFSVLFWLGYCNSAINPLIYALFSHEFRIAFKRIVCRCVCTRSGFRASENFQMMAARALMAPATFHKTISACSDEGDGPDFS